jgi:hypothetical protein
MLTSLACPFHLPELKFEVYRAHSCKWKSGYGGWGTIRELHWKKIIFFSIIRSRFAWPFLFWTGQRGGSFGGRCMIRPSRKFAFFSLVQSDLHLVRQSALF